MYLDVFDVLENWCIYLFDVTILIQFLQQKSAKESTYDNGYFLGFDSLSFVLL